MPDRLEPILRKVCQVLAGLLILRVLWVVFRPNPLAHLQIPELPQLADAASTNRPPGQAVAGSPAGKPGTNSVAAATNSTAKGTNAASVAAAAAGKTNAPSTNQATAKPSPAAPGGMPPMPGMPPGMPPGMAMMGPMMGMPGGRPGGAGAIPLDPLVTARLEKIIQSELLGPVPHPLPAALMGIAGPDAFIRTSSGMSGLVHEGGELGGMKLLRIGTNRVLVEEGGVKKELMIFGGEGGVSLMTP